MRYILTTLILTVCSLTIYGQAKITASTIPFSGFYVNGNYLKTIQKTKSPRKAQEMSEDLSFVIIPDMTYKETELVFNFHEGSPPLTIIKNKDNYEFWTFENDKV